MSLFLLYSEKNSIKDNLVFICNSAIPSGKYQVFLLQDPFFFFFFFFLCLFLKMWRLILCFRKFLIRKEGMHYLGK